MFLLPVYHDIGILPAVLPGARAVLRNFHTPSRDTLIREPHKYFDQWSGIIKVYVEAMVQLVRDSF